MPVLIPTNKDAIREQMAMIREGIQVHNDECCTANDPCNLRRGMTDVYEQLNAVQNPATTPRVSAPAPAKRPQGSGNGFGTAKPVRTGRDASDAQKNMIRKLAAAKSITEYQDQPLEEFLSAMKATDVNAAREYMLNHPWPKKAAVARAYTAPAEVTEGMYKTSNGDVYKVQRAVHGSGRLYAKKLVEDGGDWYFEREVGGIRKLTANDRMTLEEAKEFGKLYGVCCVCSATLTDEKSIAEGIGPVCGGKKHW